MKRIRVRHEVRYVLRQTYLDRGVLKARDLMDLGGDPSAHVHCAGENGFYFGSAIEESLLKQGVRFSSEDLERVFEIYLPPRYRAIIERFRRGPEVRNRAQYALEDIAPPHRTVHIFDARRLYYLRFGRVDQGELGARHWKFLDIFRYKARDEIESAIDDMERELPPREYATYVYASLGIPLLLPEYLRGHPLAVDREKLDGHILGEVCRLNGDEDFFLGAERPDRDGLHPYLTKYVWLYFDSRFQGEFPDGIFQGGAGFGRMSAPRPPVSIERAYEVFGISAALFSRMTGGELARLYRRKAKRLHPDRGGNHDDFVKLSQAYERLLASRK